MFRTKIDPANLNPKTEKLLAALLENNPEKKIFLAVDAASGEPIVYHVPIPTTKHPEAACEVILKKHMVSYPHNKGAHQKRIAVCDAKPIGKHSSELSKFYSKVKIKTNKSENGDFSIVTKPLGEKERFVKLSETSEEVVRENSFLCAVSMFGAKGLVSEDGISAQVMRRKKGRSLIDYLIDDYKKSMFTIEQRLKLWIMAGEAIINQPHAHNIIHRDIKADNMMVLLDEDNNPVEVTIIDYEHAKGKNEKVDENVGTSEPVDYRAPEVKANISSDEKSDAYSFATLLKVYGWRKLATKPRYQDLSDRQKALMTEIMALGVHPDPSKRANIKDIVAVLKAVLSEHQVTQGMTKRTILQPH